MKHQTEVRPLAADEDGIEWYFSPGPIRRRLRAWYPRWHWGCRGVALWGFHRKRKARWFDRLILGRDVDTLYQEFTAAGYTNDRGTVVHG